MGRGQRKLGQVIGAALLPHVLAIALLSSIFLFIVLAQFIRAASTYLERSPMRLSEIELESMEIGSLVIARAGATTFVGSDSDWCVVTIEDVEVVDANSGANRVEKQTKYTPVTDADNVRALKYKYLAFNMKQNMDFLVVKHLKTTKRWPA